jgi:hypothetical protein
VGNLHPKQKQRRSKRQDGVPDWQIHLSTSTLQEKPPYG